MKKFGVFLFIFLSGLLTVWAKEDLTPNSPSAILIETSTGEVLYEKNSDERRAPASMTKIMSMLLVMEKIDEGKLQFSDNVLISKNAASMGGSQIFLQEGESYQVGELLKGIAVASANDAVVALAEKVGGSVDGFVTMMNEKAKELGLTNTHFKNPHGLDEDDHYSSARDMSIMGKELLKHEKILEFTSIYEDYLKKPDGSSTWLVNTNRLVRFYNGVDGLKTGFTKNASYCVTTTAKRNDMRLLSVVMGAKTSDDRSSDTTSLLNYGFNSYQVKKILDQGSVVGSIFVERGKEEQIDVIVPRDIRILESSMQNDKTYHYEVFLDSLKAPKKASEKVGEIMVKDEEGSIVLQDDVVLAKDANLASLWDVFVRMFKITLTGN